MTVEQALQEAKALDQARQEAGFDQPALDQAARNGFANGAFEDTEEDGGQVLEEFYPDTVPAAQPSTRKPNLQQRLVHKAQGDAGDVTHPNTEVSP